MMQLQASKISKSYGVNLILSNITLEVQSRDRIGLVGRNGAGKSTLLKIIAGLSSYDSGELIVPSDVSVGYLAQDIILDADASIWDEMIKVFAPLVEMETQLHTLETKMADPKAVDEKLLHDYDQLQATYKNQGGYTYQSEIRAVLNGLGFGDFAETTPIASLSGGQKTRLNLGKRLLEAPDVLILDEPTNHLDIDTMTWLEGYLQNYPGALVITSHDRYFLDHTIDRIEEISRGEIHHYHGNYSYYLQERANRFEQEMKAYEKQQKEVARLEDFVQRNIVRASTSKRAQSRRKQLEKMERIGRPGGDERSANFFFDIKRQSGREVLEAKDLSVGYEEPLFRNINFEAWRSERIALIGPNGIGKTTLLKTLAKIKPPLAGSVHHGSHVTTGYYDQEQATLSPQKTVLDELWDEHTLTPEKDIRTVLGNFLFSGEDVLKQVADLSGGEKARLSLAKLMMQEANLLIMDEPTNHLDLDSKEILEAALADYPGTIVFVSHDRYFINRIADKVAELSSDGLHNYLGDYDYYVEKKAEMKELERLASEESPLEVEQDAPSEGKQTYEAEKKAKQEERRRMRRIEELEGQIDELEQTIEEKEHTLTEPEVYEDHEKAAEINNNIESDRKRLDELMEEWEGLQT